MPFSRELRIIRSWLWLAVVSTAAAGVIAYLVTSQAPITYTSQVSVLVGPPLAGEISSVDIDVGQALRNTYAELATTRPVLNRVIASTGAATTPQDLQSDISVQVPTSGNLLTIVVTYETATGAAALANALAADLANYAAPDKVPEKPSNITLTVVDPATPPTGPDDRRILRSSALGAAIGLLFAICIAFIVENLPRRGRSGEGWTEERPSERYVPREIPAREVAARQVLASDRSARATVPRPPASEFVGLRGQVDPRELATAVFITGSQALEPGRRYAIRIEGQRLQVAGPVDLDRTIIALDRPLAEVHATAIDGRVVVSESARGDGMAFMSVMGSTSEGLASAIADAATAAART